MAIHKGEHRTPSKLYEEFKFIYVGRVVDEIT
jgi:hypothetical protein